jgi:hypothetical protein
MPPEQRAELERPLRHGGGACLLDPVAARNEALVERRATVPPAPAP